MTRLDSGAAAVTRKVPPLIPGLAIAVALALVAVAVTQVTPSFVGAPMVGIVLGIVASPLARHVPWPVAPGAKFGGRYVLQTAIVLFGAGLSIAAVARIGKTALPAIAVVLLACLGMAWLASRLLGVTGDLRLLIASGTGICGGSAIGAIAPVIAASEASVAYAMSTIFAFNALALLIFPIVGDLLSMNAEAFGLWAGTSINDTSSVVAAAQTHSQAALDQSVVVKLTRTLMLIPLIVAIALVRRRQLASAEPAVSGKGLRGLVPPFVILFVLAAIVNSLGLVPSGLEDILSTAAKFGVTIAMVSIGLQIKPAEMKRAGWRPLAFGGTLSLTVALAGLAMVPVVT